VTPTLDTDPNSLARRLEAMPGLEALRLATGGMPAYLVGGSVRDLLLGRDRSDLDVVLDGDPGDVAARLGGALAVHERFGTARVRVEGLEVDLAGARSERYPSPGALPEVQPATLAEDLARRDFTVNAMALPLEGQPELIDPHGGLADLAAGVLRLLHAGSIADDPIRALRGARYAARFSFRLDPETEALVRGADLATVSEDRVRAELLRLAAEPEAVRGFQVLDELGLLTLPEDATRLLARLDLILRDPPWSEVADRAQAILAAAQGEGGAWRELAAASPPTPSAAVELARGRPGPELALARAAGAEWLDGYVADWRLVALEIDGSDLLAAGVPEGPAVGRGLAAALARKLDGEVQGREQELMAALKAAQS
jgi:tRNA nucleotidyltransferase (CCA-adding enzyme)